LERTINENFKEDHYLVGKTLICTRTFRLLMYRESYCFKGEENIIKAVSDNGEVLLEPKWSLIPFISQAVILQRGEVGAFFDTSDEELRAWCLERE
jgi:hypothetical protein